MSRYESLFQITQPYQALFPQIRSYLELEGYDYTNYKGEDLFKKGVGLVSAPSFVSISFPGNMIRIQAFIKFAFLPGVYGDDMDLEGFTGIAVKKPLKSRVERIEQMVAASGGILVSRNLHQTLTAKQAGGVTVPPPNAKTEPQALPQNPQGGINPQALPQNPQGGVNPQAYQPVNPQAAQGAIDPNAYAAAQPVTRGMPAVPQQQVPTYGQGQQVPVYGQPTPPVFPNGPTAPQYQQAQPVYGQPVYGQGLQGYNPGYPPQQGYQQPVYGQNPVYGQPGQPAYPNGAYQNPQPYAQNPVLNNGFGQPTPPVFPNGPYPNMPRDE